MLTKRKTTPKKKEEEDTYTKKLKNVLRYLNNVILRCRRLAPKCFILIALLILKILKELVNNKIYFTLHRMIKILFFNQKYSSAISKSKQ